MAHNHTNNGCHKSTPCTQRYTASLVRVNWIVSNLLLVRTIFLRHSQHTTLGTQLSMISVAGPHKGWCCSSRHSRGMQSQAPYPYERQALRVAVRLHRTWRTTDLMPAPLPTIIFINTIHSLGRDGDCTDARPLDERSVVRSNGCDGVGLSDIAGPSRELTSLSTS